MSMRSRRIVLPVSVDFPADTGKAMTLSMAPVFDGLVTLPQPLGGPRVGEACSSAGRTLGADDLANVSESSGDLQTALDLDPTAAERPIDHHILTLLLHFPGFHDLVDCS
jgi:hypothetical protein